MKAISILQPWAMLLGIQAKVYETRSWPTEYRGPVAIHSSKRFPKEYMELCFEEPFQGCLLDAGLTHFDQLPRGMIIAVGELNQCLRTERLRSKLSDQELAFGDYSDGRFAWRLSNVQKLKEPIPAKGSLGLWDWEPPASVKELLGI